MATNIHILIATFTDYIQAVHKWFAALTQTQKRGCNLEMCVFFFLNYVIITDFHISHLHNKCSYGRLVFQSLHSKCHTLMCMKHEWSMIQIILDNFKHCFNGNTSSQISLVTSSKYKYNSKLLSCTGRGFDPGYLHEICRLVPLRASCLDWLFFLIQICKFSHQTSARIIKMCNTASL